MYYVLFSVGLIGGVDLINQLPPSFMLLLDIPFSVRSLHFVKVMDPIQFYYCYLSISFQLLNLIKMTHHQFEILSLVDKLPF